MKKGKSRRRDGEEMEKEKSRRRDGEGMGERGRQGCRAFEKRRTARNTGRTTAKERKNGEKQEKRGRKLRGRGKEPKKNGQKNRKKFENVKEFTAPKDIFTMKTTRDFHAT